jgi:hypothetical protein
MKFASDRPYADSEKAARKLVEIANSVEAVQGGRIHIEQINYRFYSAGCDRASISIRFPVTHRFTLFPSSAATKPCRCAGWSDRRDRPT